PRVAGRNLLDERRELHRPELGQHLLALAGPDLHRLREGGGLPARFGPLGYAVEVAPGFDAGRELLREPVVLGRVFVAMLDEQPVLAAARFRFGVAARHVDEHPLTLHTLAVEGELEVTFLEALMRIADRLPNTFVPQHHRTAA